MEENSLKLSSNDSLTSLLNLTKKLDISNSDLMFTPIALEFCSNLTDLDISKNLFTVIPYSLCKLSKLQVVNLNDNKIIKFPRKLNNFINLKEIYLDNNQISKIPSNINMLTKLKILSLCNNKIKKISDELALVKTLDKLYLSGNCIQNIPVLFGDHPRLSILYINNNKLSDFPIEGRWIHLKKLDISNNQLNETMILSLQYFSEIRKINIKELPQYESSHSLNTHKRSGSFTQGIEQDIVTQNPITDIPAISPRKKPRLIPIQKARKRSGTEGLSLKDLKKKKKIKKDNANVTNEDYISIPNNIDVDSVIYGEEGIEVATLDQLLVFLLYDSDKCDINDFQRYFILIYPSIIEDKTLVEYLFSNFEGPTIIKTRIIHLLKLMVIYHKTRFTDQYPGGDTIRQLIIDFITSNCTNKEFSKELLSILGYLNDGIVGIEIRSNGENIFNMNPKKIAQQLCLIEHNYLKQIDLHELLDKNFEKEDSAFRVLSKWFGKLSGFVCSTILQTGETTKRTELLSWFISVAYKCIELRNYSSAMSIFSALQSSSIQRLKISWQGVSVKTYNLNQEIEEFLTVSKNFCNYRNALKEGGNRYIPILSLLERDLIHIEENDKYLKDIMINFKRCNLLGALLWEFHSCKQERYPFTQLTNVQEQLMAAKELDTKVLWNLSILLEPNQNSKQFLARKVTLLSMKDSNNSNKNDNSDTDTPLLRSSSFRKRNRMRVDSLRLSVDFNIPPEIEVEKEEANEKPSYSAHRCVTDTPKEPKIRKPKPKLKRANSLKCKVKSGERPRHEEILRMLLENEKDEVNEESKKAKTNKLNELSESVKSNKKLTESSEIIKLSDSNKFVRSSEPQIHKIRSKKRKVKKINNNKC